MKSKISITYIIPTFNSFKGLKKTIDCLLTNIDENDSIIIIDDFSSDETSSFIKKIYSNNIIYIRNKRNRGVAYSRNYASQFVSTDYFSYLDSGDTYTKEYFLSIKKLLNQYKYPSVIRYSNSQFKKTDLNLDTPLKIISHRELQNYYSGYYLHSSCTQIIKTTDYLNANVKFNESLQYGEDLLFSFQLLRRVSSTVLLPDSFYIYEYDSLSASNILLESCIINRIKDINSVYTAIYQELDKVEQEFLTVLMIKERREISMQLMKLFIANEKMYYQVIKDYFNKINGKLIINKNNIYDIHVLFLAHNFKFVNYIFLKIYKALKITKDKIMILKKAGGNQDD